MISNPSQNINLLVLAVVLSILVKRVTILKLGLRSISKRITSLKIKEALDTNWRKPNLNAQPNCLALILSLQLLSFLALFVFAFLFFYFRIFLLSIIFIISDTNYRHLLLSYAITSSHYNTPSITSFYFIYCFHYLSANYQHLLLS